MRTVVLAALGLLIAAPSIPAQDQPTGWAAKLFKDENGKIPPPGTISAPFPRGRCSSIASRSPTSTRCR